MKYFIDTEFIEGFTNPWIGKRRHFIDLISIGIVCEDGREYYAVSKDYEYKDASQWVKDNVIATAYTSMVSGDARNHVDAKNFHRHFGKSNQTIAEEVKEFCIGHYLRGEETDIEFWGYFADYDWVLFCSLFGKMMDLPKGFPYYCNDLKQLLFTHGLTDTWKQAYCPDPEGEHNALVDAKWNKQLYFQIETMVKRDLHWGETLMGHFKPDAG